MRSSLPLIAAILLAQLLSAEEHKPWNVGRLCGRVEHIRRIPDRHTPNNFSEKRKNLNDVSLSLFKVHEHEACCEGLTPVDATVTGKRGGFEFKTTVPGSYWISTYWNGKTAKVPVYYQPDKAPPTVCSEQGLQLDDDGNAEWWIAVTVD
ncbi:MAG: hypothetical protein H0X25_03925 [Acidobacteriales bacterium]|nr:hypothetical protein [Terriglobales bacterium]